MPKTSFDKELTENTFQIALIGGVLFLLFSHPFLFHLVDRVFEFVGVDLGPTIQTMLHSVIFTIGFFYSIRLVVRYT